MNLIGLPVDFERSERPNAGLGFVIYASAAALSIKALNDAPFHRKIEMKVSFPRGNEYESFHVQTEIVWKDVHFWEGWDGYHYALKFVMILENHYLKFKRLFCRPSCMEEDPT